MFTLHIPGVGDVEVESKEALLQLKKQLDGHYQQQQKAIEEKEKLPDKMLALLGGMIKENKKGLDSIVAEVKKIKPQVTVNQPDIKVDAPVVNVPTQEIKVDIPPITIPKAEKTKPIKSVTCTKVERDWKGVISGATFEVQR